MLANNVPFPVGNIEQVLSITAANCRHLSISSLAQNQIFIELELMVITSLFVMKGIGQDCKLLFRTDCCPKALFACKYFGPSK